MRISDWSSDVCSSDLAKPFSVGLNCAFGAQQLRPYVAELSRVADVPVSAYPNAGLPNQFGEYDEEPHTTASHLRESRERSEERSVGKEGLGTVRSWWWPDH